MNICTLLDMAAEAFGDRVALVSGEQRLSYAELRERALAAAQMLRETDARYLALLDTNSVAAPVAIFAAAYAGVPYVPINYRLTSEEVNELVACVAPAVLVASADTCARLAPREDVRVLLREAFLSLPVAVEASLEPPDDPRAVAVQLFTSGTTGKPKAAILRHENLMSYIVGTVEFGAAEEDDAILVSVPPHHNAGISAMLSSTYACRRMVQLPNFDARAWLVAAREERVSNAFLVPTMLARIVEALGEHPAELPCLRALAYGGGKMPLTTIASAMRLFPNVAFTNAYGLTETSSTIAVLGPEDHRVAASSADPAVQRRLGSVGRATGAVEIEIRGEDCKRLPPNARGGVYVRGGQVSGEYLQQGRLLDAEGWFWTRDQGWLDEAGYLFLDGRADDVIVRGGENISPGEIEDVLLSHPAVADVAVVAVPDEQWGEGVGAAIVLKRDAAVSAQDLQALVKSRLRSSRVPQRVVFRDALPYNETGKLLRREVREELAVL